MGKGSGRRPAEISRAEFDAAWERNFGKKRELRPDEPCSHRGCLAHVSHPCEGCGRIAGQYVSGAGEIRTHDPTVMSRPL